MMGGQETHGSVFGVVAVLTINKEEKSSGSKRNT